MHVLHIAKTTLYDDHSDIGDAMNEMMGKYASQSWHYVDPTTGESPDLHHAILYRSMNAGVFSVLLISYKLASPFISTFFIFFT